MRDQPRKPTHAGAETSPAVWTGRATNKAQWVLAAAGAACTALGIQLAVSSNWTSGVIPLLMSVIGCVAAGLLMLFGTLAFVNVAVRVDGHALEVRCGHMGLPRRRILLTHVVGADFVPRVTPRQWGGWGYRWRPEQGTAVVVRKGRGWSSGSATAGPSRSRWTTRKRAYGSSASSSRCRRPAQRPVPERARA